MILYNILIVGVGGQGAVTFGNFFQDYALQDPRIKDFVATESRGVSQREGSVYSLIRYILEEPKEQATKKKKKIPAIAPVIPKGKVDLFIALEPLEFLRYLDFLSPMCLCIVNTRKLIPKSIITNKNIKYPDIEASLQKIHQTYPKLKIIAEDFTSQIEELNSPMFMVNKQILQGLINQSHDFFDNSILKSLIQSYFL